MEETPPPILEIPLPISGSKLATKPVTNEPIVSLVDPIADLSTPSTATFRRPWSDWSQVPPTPPAWAYGLFFTLEIGAAGLMDDLDLQAFGLWQLPPLWDPSPLEDIYLTPDNFDPIRRLRKWLQHGLVGHILLDPTRLEHLSTPSSATTPSMIDHTLDFIIQIGSTDHIALTILGADHFSLSASLL